MSIGRVVRIGGKTVWIMPKHVVLFKHKLPSGKVLARAARIS